MLNHEAATDQASTPAGRIASFGKYLLLQRVSVGGMAEVFKAIPEGASRIDQIVAIKRILPNIAEDREFIGMFIDEARIAGQLTHPNICRIYELGRVGADHYIAMQFLWGRDLLKVMNRFKRAGLLIPPPMAVFTAAHACAALHYAHNKRDSSGAPLNIIHRDVSPQNIIVGYSGQAKLIDFGVARAASQSQKTQAGILKGKFGYMSPEMIRGLPVDHRSDVFAMGICLHEALTGSRLFYGETDFATLELVRDANIVPPSGKVPSIPPALDAIVLKALSRDAELRYQSAEEMEQALLEFLDAYYPGYGEADVSACMREAFGHELTREKQRLDAFAQMLARGQLVRGATPPAMPVEPPPSGERAMTPEELALTRVPTRQSQLTDEEVKRLSGEHDLEGEQTQIFFSNAELSELRQMDVEPDFELGPTRSPTVSDVVLRGPAGYPGEPVMPAPSFPKLTPSGTYERRFDEQGRAPVAAPESAYGGMRAPGQRGIATQTIRAFEGELPADEPLGAGQPPRRHGALHTALLATAAVALGALGYWAVRVTTHRTATLEIAAVDDPDALVRVDGVLRGNPPLSVEGLSPGLHSLELEARGFELARADIHVEAGETRPVNLVLSPKGAPSIDTLPAQVPANVAPAPVGPAILPTPIGTAAVPNATSQTPAEQLTAVPGTGPKAVPRAPMRPRVVEQVEGEQPATAVVATQGTGETQVSEAFNDEAAAAGEGELLISTVPWTRVIIDGTDTGRDTPVRALRVPSGAHKIVLKTPEGVEHEVSVVVQPGKTVRIIRRFE